MRQEPEQKVLENWKNKECQDREVQFIRKQDLVCVNYVCLYRAKYKAMSEISDQKLYSVITNVCKRARNFDSPEAKQSFMFVWFDEFPWICYFPCQRKQKGDGIFPYSFSQYYLLNTSFRKSTLGNIFLNVVVPDTCKY